MTLSVNFDDHISTSDALDNSVNLNSLYCSHLWTNSNLRNAIISAPCRENMITYCYTCKGKIRKYEVKSPRSFMPHNHSTPNKEVTVEQEEIQTIDREEYRRDRNRSQTICSYSTCDSRESEAISVGSKQHIPSISQQIDSNFRQKYVSHEIEANIRRQRLRKSLKGFGCIVNFATTDTPVKKRTQIQACSISIMIVAIVIISFILVNFTSPSSKGESNKISTTVVPITKVDFNETASTITNIIHSEKSITVNITKDYFTTTESSSIVSTGDALSINVIAKIRNNIKTFPKLSNAKGLNEKPKDVNSRDLSQRFCSCQKNEICMLDESSGTSICRKPIDNDDPTGCGGLCALETEACQLVDKARGVRVCRSLTLVTCSPDEWRCRNGLCVPEGARCDGTIECYDRSDEMHCECDLTKQFRCGHSISCFAHTKLCDGVIDCWDGFDELNCTTECPDDQFTCTNGQCITATRFCDGLADCADSSDEPDGCGDCGAHEIRCKNQRCVPRTAHCDGHDNCGDATDELYCIK